MLYFCSYELVLHLTQSNSKLLLWTTRPQTIWPPLPLRSHSYYCPHCGLYFSHIILLLTPEHVSLVPTSGSLHLLFSLLECCFPRYSSTWLTQMSFKSVLTFCFKSLSRLSLKNSTPRYHHIPWFAFFSFPALFFSKQLSAFDIYHLLLYFIISIHLLELKLHGSRVLFKTANHHKSAYRTVLIT